MTETGQNKNDDSIIKNESMNQHLLLQDNSSDENEEESGYELSPLLQDNKSDDKEEEE